MPAFDVLWLRWLLIMVVGGLALTAALVLGFYLDVRSRGQPGQDKEGEEFPAGIRIARGRIPVLLVVLYVGVGIFIIAYVIFAWLSGASY